MITVHLNGEPKEVLEGLTLSTLLEWLKLPADRVAIEWNQQVVPRRRWADVALQAGDRLEIVHFVGGGRPLPVRKRRWAIPSAPAPGLE